MNIGYQQMDNVSSAQKDPSATNGKRKPAIPKKPVLPSDVGRSTHVRDMVRKLQAKESPNGVNLKPCFIKLPTKPGKHLITPGKEEISAQTSNQTLEDLKAIDEDIEKLRKQIEERDKIISALRGAAEAKDKKLDNLMLEFSKLQSNGKLDLDSSLEVSRPTSTSPSSPPLCNGELCWTDSFVNKNYHEPVYAQLLNDHTALQRIYNELRTKLELKGKEFEELKAQAEAETRTTDEETSKIETQENAINLIMAEQIRILKDREAQLIAEAEELREQNDLMEFRILELEECRKEFLEKEVMNEGKHRTEKIVWSDDISDSGVMSLPTSEDLTSDSELGDAIRNYSPLGAITNLGLLSGDQPHSEPGTNDLKLKKSLKSTECLQESGIFEDSEPSSERAIATGGSSQKHSKACQTESLLDKNLLDFIDSSCDLFLSKNRERHKSDDLSTEISKLSVIQKRIQQKTSSPAPKVLNSAYSCPHSNSLIFYEERLSQLEDKLRIYESSGDTKDVLLAKRLQKEVDLAHRVKELSDKVATLEATNRRLEEEKCEFEEAENDTRFQCQRLEIKLQELIEKNTELEVEVERQKIIMNKERRREKKKGNLEGLLSRYDQKSFELEEREMEARQKLSMIEAAMPAIVAWNMYKMVQSPEFVNAFGHPNDVHLANGNSKAEYHEADVEQKLEELLDDQKKLRMEYEKVEESATDREKALRSKIEELEAKAAKDREILEEMTNFLKALKSEEKTEGDVESSNSLKADEVDLFEEVKQLISNELQLRAELERLEKKEEAYMHSLEKADEIWASMEEDYKRRLREAESANNELHKRVSQLEATQEELEKALMSQSTLQTTRNKSKNEVESKIEELLKENDKLKKEITQSLDKKFEEHRQFLEAENASLRAELNKMKTNITREEKRHQDLLEELEAAKAEMLKERVTAERFLRDQISDLNQELSQKSKELSNLEVTVAELREEVETLESKIEELISVIQNNGSAHEEFSVHRENACVARAVPVEVSEWSLPIKEVVADSRGTSFNSPFLQTSEVLIKKEKELPSLRVLIPSQHNFRFLTFAQPFSFRQQLKFLSPLPRFVSKILNESPKIIHKTTPQNNFIYRKSENSIEMSKKEEILQLILKNTELLQTLEKMEEESKLKEKELEELQKIAREILEEQETLEELYEAKKGELENTEGIVKNVEGEKFRVCDPKHKENTTEEDRQKRSQSKDVFYTFSNAIVRNTSEQTGHPLSSLQIALDNLQDKYRGKNVIIDSVIKEMRQKGDNTKTIVGAESKVSEKASEVDKTNNKYYGRKKNSTTKTERNDSERKSSSSTNQPSNPRSTKRTSSATYSILLSSAYPKYVGELKAEVDPHFTFVAPIKKLRKVDEEKILMEWELTHPPPELTGFEILVNGQMAHRVLSPSRNRALLHSLNFNDRILIELFAMSENGRSIECSNAIYAEESFLNKKVSF